MSRQQLIHAARERSARIKAVAQHFRAAILEPIPMPHTHADLTEYVRELSLTSAVREYLRAKSAEREN